MLSSGVEDDKFKFLNLAKGYQVLFDLMVSHIVVNHKFLTSVSVIKEYNVAMLSLVKVLPKKSPKQNKMAVI